MITTKLVRIQTYLRPGQKANLDRYSETSGVPVAELIRRAVDRYMTEVLMFGERAKEKKKNRDQANG